MLAIFPDISYQGASEMSESDWREFLEWYGHKATVFDNRRVFESYCKG